MHQCWAYQHGRRRATVGYSGPPSYAGSGTPINHQALLKEGDWGLLSSVNLLGLGLILACTLHPENGQALIPVWRTFWAANQFRKLTR